MPPNARINRRAGAAEAMQILDERLADCASGLNELLGRFCSAPFNCLVRCVSHFEGAQDESTTRLHNITEAFSFHCG